MTEFERGVEAAIRAVGVELRRKSEEMKDAGWSCYHNGGKRDDAISFGAKADVLLDVANALQSAKIEVVPNV